MKKFQPVEKWIIPNDKITKKIFEFSDEDFAKVLKVKAYSVNEGMDQKGAVIITPIKLESQQSDAQPPNQFDRAVFTACVSEYDAGNTQLTPAIIYRAITGKREHFQTPTPKQAVEILESVLKMSSLRFDESLDAKLTATFKKLGYNNGKPIKIKDKAILPCEIINEGNVNGGSAKTLISLTAEPPLMTIARAKKQLLTVENFKELLDTESANHSDITAAKFYTMIRIVETLGSRKLTPIITFADIFEKCRLQDATRKAKMIVRNAIIGVMENFFCAGLIKDFELKKASGGKFHSIEFKKK
jgi:hypothetical protein